MKSMRMFNKKIEYGDIIFARLTIGHNTVVEFMNNRVADLTELIAELRRMSRGMRGLATLHIRNQSKGWATQRPLMLYAPTEPTRKPTVWTNPFEAIDHKPEIPAIHQLYM